MILGGLLVANPAAAIRGDPGGALPLLAPETSRAILEECGVEFDDSPDDLGSPCTEQVSGIYAC